MTSAKNCNQEAVQRMIEDPQAAITYDPVGAISLPMADSSIANGANVIFANETFIYMCVFVFKYVYAFGVII